MKPGEFRNMNDEELVHTVGQLKRDLFSLKFQQSTGQLEKTHRLKDIQRDIARAQTVLRERQATSAGQPGEGGQA